MLACARKLEEQSRCREQHIVPVRNGRLSRHCCILLLQLALLQRGRRGLLFVQDTLSEVRKLVHPWLQWRREPTITGTSLVSTTVSPPRGARGFGTAYIRAQHRASCSGEPYHLICTCPRSDTDAWCFTPTLSKVPLQLVDHEAVPCARDTTNAQSGMDLRTSVLST